MPKAQMAPIPCIKCGGEMYDNIADKAAGKRGARAPDYACKDKDGCGHGVWLKDSEKNAIQAQAAARAGGGARPAGQIVLDKAMDMCVAAAKDILTKNIATGQPVSPELIVNMATTLFIGRTRDRSGILRAEKEIVVAQRKKAEEAERKRIEEEARKAQDRQAHPDFEDFPGALQDGDDDLPF